VVPRSPNKHMQRAVRHKVLGRGRVAATPCRAPRARGLLTLRTGADESRWAARSAFLASAGFALWVNQSATYLSERHNQNVRGRG
jgi:hypothetical protein